MHASRRQALALLLGTGLLAQGGRVGAQPGADDGYKPSTGQAGKDVVWVPTPDRVVERMLHMAEVKPADTVVDLGSGDGKIAIAAARHHGATALGLEFNPRMVALSQRLAREAGVSDKVSFQEADIFVSDFSRATVVTMYLLPQLNLRLRPKLFAMAPGIRVVSHSFDMGDWAPDEQSRAGNGQLYLWIIPANASGHWRVSLPDMRDAPRVLRLMQKYQVLSGDARFDETALVASVLRPQLSGDALSFGVRDAAGTVLQFSGRLVGDRIRGTMRRGDAAPVPFEAERSEPPGAIAGLPASDAEMVTAARKLGADQ